MVIAMLVDTCIEEANRRWALCSSILSHEEEIIGNETNVWRTGSDSRKAIEIELTLKGGILALIEPTVAMTE
jgi:hypothetical protein